MKEVKTFKMKRLISPCGLDYSKCIIYLAPYHWGVANKLVRNSREYGKIQALKIFIVAFKYKEKKIKEKKQHK